MAYSFVKGKMQRRDAFAISPESALEVIARERGWSIYEPKSRSDD
jgi:hypothetical protein